MDDVDTENVKNIPERHSRNRHTITKAHDDLTAELKKKPLINNFFEQESQQKIEQNEQKPPSKPHHVKFDF